MRKKGEEKGKNKGRKKGGIKRKITGSRKAQGAKRGKLRKAI